ncbi:PIN domain-containing protein [Granulosicoccus antarcticus]|uniref:Ribonuclease VapC n=1 Tax=Granulosicoccus antarcticus IMCC3135 TaxID=1192854 RepID=A0A2Z2P2C3_9GAMM|nr:type II toxin-antitoxin system VapC family toxin [Granulosicoccus antarcticus]ASJ76761.1 tRNA(fMet)-specific endonuclease VapC [Granulosicoccus antarcticus IMCC3135]
MPAIDTNVLVRYLIADDRKQFETAKQFIEEAITNEALFIPVSVSVELEWVLRSLYEVKKAMIITTFNRLLEAREIEFQEESAIEIALSLYADNNADFADCLHIASAQTQGRVPLVTLDRKASRIEGAKLLV